VTFPKIDSLNIGADTDIDPGPSSTPFQVVDIRARVRQHVVHARPAVRRLRHRPHEADARIEQPAKRVGDFVAQDPAQLVVVARRETAGESRHVGPVIGGAVGDAAAQLVRRAGRADRADRPGGRAAELPVLLEQQHARAGGARLDGSGEARAAAADDDHVELLVQIIPPAV
jgi:hypothetical protein